MNLPMKWLADFTDVSDVDIKAYCDRMTDTGSKVEGYTQEGSSFSKVVVGKLLSITQHPNADKLVICSVDVGGENPLQIVTGAKNVFEGALVPVALDGALLPGDVKIKKGKLRGEVSEGMLCSFEEMGLTLHEMPGAAEDGILILSDVGLGDAVPGTDIKELFTMQGHVVEFEITPNRPDCLSVIGLARESAVTFDRPLHIPAPQVKALGDGDSIEKYLRVDIACDELCYRYSAAAVKNVKIEPSPLWLRMRLHAAGVRPINNIVDITNYVMLEYGQPMHAFDYACLEGSHIIVRRAAQQEAYTSLDSKEHVLDDSMLVIADETKAVALAGIMGGENSEITDDTKLVIFESACFKGSNVRITSRKLGMRTESSARFEKGMDPENTMPALQRALELIQQLGAGEVVDGIIDVYPGKKEQTVIQLEAQRINRFLGVQLDQAYMEQVLERLGFVCRDGMVEVPSWRADVECMEDLAEEVVRIYGYNKIPSTEFKGPMTQGGRNKKQQFEVRVSDALCDMGMDEIHTFSFISPRYYDKIRMAQDDPRRNSVVIKNPLGEDTSVMRTTALPSMLEALSYNYSQKNQNVHLYEMASLYLPIAGEQLPKEPKSLVLGFYENNMDSSACFYRMKGYVEAILALAGIAGVQYVSQADNRAFHPGRCAEIILGEVCLGVFGEMHPAVCETYGFGVPAYGAELDFDALFQVRKTKFEYTPLPKYPALERDFSFVCDEDLETGAVREVMLRAGGKMVVDVSLFDVYRGPQVGEGKKSVSFAVMLRAADRTLTDEEADAIAEKIMKRLHEEYGVVLRG